jgi:DNA primase
MAQGTNGVINAGGSDTVQQIKEKLSITEVVAPYVKLTKSGKYMRGLSPFTKEKTPSFFVSVDRGTYHCFSTDQGGDIFTFVEKMEGVDFRGALKILAEKAGVEIVNERVDRGRSDRIDRLRDAMTQAVTYFQKNLSVGSDAYNYVLSRGLTAEMIKEWQLGFAPAEWRGLLEELQAGQDGAGADAAGAARAGAKRGGGFTAAELTAAGLIKEADNRAGTWYDRFRNRVMVPIRDIAGRTVAFTGRTLDPNDGAKYLNSPETELFKKGEVLFGMDRAKDAIRTRGFAILVEGQFDLLLLHQIGFTNTIALSGTALTPQHLSLIKRYADNLMLCLDADRAGLAASAKHAEAALRAGFRVKAVRLPEGKDPADLASENPKDFAKRVSDATSIVEFFLAVLSASEHDSHKLVLAAESTVIPLLAAVQSPLEREHFIGITANALGLPAEAVRSSIPKTSIQTTTSSARIAASSGSGPQSSYDNQPPSYSRTEMRPNSVVISKGSGGTGAGGKASIKRRGDILLAVAASYPNTPLAEMLKTEYSRIIGAPVSDELIPERAIFEAGLAYGESPAESDLIESVREFEKQVLKEKLRDATDALRRAELSHDAEAISSAVTRYKEISVRLASFS